MKDTLAVIAALIAIASVVPYLIDIVKGKTKPNLVTWLTWTTLTAIATAAAFVAGEPRTALLTLASTICTSLVVLLGWRLTKFVFTRFDLLCLGGAMLGLGLWLLFDAPIIGIAVPVIIDFIGMLPTLNHSWRKPNEETWQTFAIGTVAPLVTLFSLSAITAAGVLYPLYLFAANGLLAVVIVTRRSMLKSS